MSEFKKGTILVVDDEPASLGVLFEALEQAHFKVLIAENGASALKKVERFFPDMILLDVKLPDMDGFQLSRQIRDEYDNRMSIEYPSYKFEPAIIFLSAISNIRSRIKGFEADATDYITKPFHAGEVLARLEKHLAVKIFQKQLEEQNARLQKEIEERKNMEKLLTAILNASPVGIGKIRNRIIDWGNATIYQMLGYDQNVLLGKDIGILYENKDEYLRVGKELNEQIGKTGKGSVEARWVRKDGTVFDCYLQVCSLEPNDPDKGQIATVMDITDLKRSEKDLKSAKEAAEAANQAKSLFLANMSHELHTPLNIISGYAQLLQQTQAFSPKIREYADTIFQTGNHLLTLLNDILDISNIGTQKIEIKPYEMHFSHLLKRLTEYIRIQAQEKGIEFRYEPSSDLPIIIEADEKRLRQILLNLLENALKFTDTGQVIFRVGVRSQECKVPLQESGVRTPETNSPSPLLYFEIEDTGIGIAPEHLEKIFLPFGQIGNSGGWHEGIGTGLAITRHLIALMGGELKVRSEPGKGSVFWFEIPVLIMQGNLALPYSGGEQKELEDLENIKGLKMIPPPQQDLEELVEMAILGMMDRIGEIAECLEETDNKYIPFAAKLKKFAANFDDDKLMAFIQKYMDKQ